MIDTQPCYPVFAPRSDEGVGRREDIRILGAYSGQRCDGEEPAVVHVSVAAGVVDQLVMLPIMHGSDVVAFRPGSRSEWKAMFEVAQLAIYQR